MGPNILFYFTDQQRHDTCGCYGQPLEVTPHLDALAREGIVFQWAFSPQPVCGPCRALFQTGKWPTETGCFRNDVMLPPDSDTLARRMEGAGYETAYIGKWHLASQGELYGKMTVDHRTSPIPPEYRGGYSGFWRAADVLEFTSHGYGGYVFDEQGRRRDFSGYRADCITDLALEFFDTYDRKKPFFMTISHIEPHHQNDHGHYEGPHGSKERFADFSVPGDLSPFPGDYMQEYPDYLGACRALDDNLERVITRLKKEGLYENTVIIFASDHGSHFQTRNRDGRNLGGDDYKRTGHDSALHVPLVMGGGAVKQGVCRQIVSTAGIPKTILSLAGTEAEGWIGENLLDVAAGKCPDRRNEAFAQISESRCGRALRTADFLYGVYAPGVMGGQQGAADVYADDYLYDLRTDPYQLINVMDDPAYAEDKARLRDSMLYWIAEAEGRAPQIVDDR